MEVEDDDNDDDDEDRDRSQTDWEGREGKGGRRRRMRLGRENPAEWKDHGLVDRGLRGEKRATTRASRREGGDENGAHPR